MNNKKEFVRFALFPCAMLKASEPWVFVEWLLGYVYISFSPAIERVGVS